MKTKPEKIQLYNSKEICKLLKISAGCLCAWRANGMPCIKVSEKLIRYWLPDVLAWLEQFKVNKLPSGDQADE